MPDSNLSRAHVANMMGLRFQMESPVAGLRSNAITTTAASSSKDINNAQAHSPLFSTGVSSSSVMGHHRKNSLGSEPTTPVGQSPGGRGMGGPSPIGRGGGPSPAGGQPRPPLASPQLPQSTTGPEGGGKGGPEAQDNAILKQLLSAEDEDDLSGEHLHIS